MASRTTHHKAHAQPQPQRAQPVQPKLAPKKLTIGKPYSLEDIQKLMERLNSRDRYARASAVAQFAKDQGAITEAAARLPEVSATEITEKVIEAVMKDEKAMLERFGKERNVEALRFLAGSAAVPDRIREKAAAVVEQVPEARMEKAAVVKEKPEAPEQHAPKEIYTPKNVELVLKALESKVKDIRIAAAVQFIKDYAKITPTVAKMPLLTVTEVTKKAVEAIKAFPEETIGKMVERGMADALEFLSSLKQMPLNIRNRASEEAEKLRGRIPDTAAKKDAGKDVKEPAALKTAASARGYGEKELDALVAALESPDKAKAIKAAIEFIQRYDSIIEAVSRAPMLTVTDVTKKAVGAVERNLGSILKELGKRRDSASLNLLANSSKFSKKTREKAAAILRMLTA